MIFRTFILYHNERAPFLFHVVINMPPAFIQGFSSDDTSLTSFGSEMGTVVVPQSDQSIAATSTTPGPNITIDAGRKLTRGSWNAQPYDVINLNSFHTSDHTVDGGSSS